MKTFKEFCKLQENEMGGTNPETERAIQELVRLNQQSNNMARQTGVPPSNLFDNIRKHVDSPEDQGGWRLIANHYQAPWLSGCSPETLAAILQYKG